MSSDKVVKYQANCHHNISHHEHMEAFICSGLSVLNSPFFQALLSQLPYDKTKFLFSTFSCDAEFADTTIKFF